MAVYRFHPDGKTEKWNSLEETWSDCATDAPMQDHGLHECVISIPAHLSPGDGGPIIPINWLIEQIRAKHPKQAASSEGQ